MINESAGHAGERSLLFRESSDAVVRQNRSDCFLTYHDTYLDFSESIVIISIRIIDKTYLRKE